MSEKKQKTCVINIDKDVHSIISDYCSLKGVPIKTWATEILMEEIHRAYSKKGKRKEPLQVQA